MTIDKAIEMRCKFNDAKKCIHADLFDMWKDDKKETAWLMLGLCPKCPTYREGLEPSETEEVRHGTAS